MSKYNELMNKIEVSEEMRSRLLANISAAVNEEAASGETAGGNDLGQVEELNTVRFDANVVQPTHNGRSWKKIVAIVVPLAAVALLAVLVVPRLFAGKGAAGSVASYNSAKNDMVMEETTAAAAAGDYDAGMLTGAQEDVISEDAEAAEEEYAMDAAVPEEGVMAGGGMMETAAPGAVETATEASAYGTVTAVAPSASSDSVGLGIVFYANHHTPLTGANYPSATLVTSRSELEESFMTDSYDGPKAQEYLSEMECSAYTDEYFEQNDLLVILLEENSGSVSHVLSGIDRSGAGSPWQVHISRIVPEMQTADMAYWYVVAEVEKDKLLGSEIEVVLE